MLTHRLIRTDQGSELYIAPNIGIVKISEPTEDIIFDSTGKEIVKVTGAINTVLVDYKLK